MSCRKLVSKYAEKFVEIGNITNNNEKFNKIDFVLYAGSLGRYFRNNIDDFKKDSFINLDKKNVEDMESRTSVYKKKFKIGLSWKSFNNRYALDKSLNLEDFKNIFSISDCDIFNLQYGDVEAEIDIFNSKSNNKILSIKDLDLYNDFENIGSLLKTLDIFITISNSTAHLAGALGVKTILIKPENYALFHYWNQKNNKTPWYSSVELVDKKSFFKNSNFLKNFLNL